MKLYLQQFYNKDTPNFWHSSYKYQFVFDNDYGSTYRTQIRKNL